MTWFSSLGVSFWAFGFLGAGREGLSKGGLGSRATVDTPPSTPFYLDFIGPAPLLGAIAIHSHGADPPPRGPKNAQPCFPFGFGECW